MSNMQGRYKYEAYCPVCGAWILTSYYLPTAKRKWDHRECTCGIEVIVDVIGHSVTYITYEMNGKEYDPRKFYEDRHLEVRNKI